MWVKKLSIVYGYRPFVAIVWLALLWMLGFILFGIGYQARVISPSQKDAYSAFQAHGFVPGYYQPFCAAAYSIDTSLPIISFGQKEAWAPVPKAYSLSEAKSHTEDHGAAYRILCEANPLNRFVNSPLASATFLRVYRWCHIALGWFLSMMFIAGVSGLVRRI